MNAPLRESAIRLSADVGGTFTDVAAFDEATGALRLGKTLTTPQRLVDGIENGVGKAGSQFSAARLFLHGTTVAINTILERSGAKCALLTTPGFPRHLRDRPRQPAGVLQPVLPEARAADRPRSALRDHGADGFARHRADPARRGAGARRGAAGGGPGRAGDRHPVPALLPQRRPRAARQGDRRKGISRAVRHRVARAEPGVSRVRAHLDRCRQRLCRPARAVLPRRDGIPSQQLGIRRKFPDRAVDRRAVRRRRRPAVLHPHAGVRPGGRRGRHQGAVRLDQDSERHRLRHGRYNGQGRRHLRRHRADDRLGADRRLCHRASGANADDRHPGGRHRRRQHRPGRGRQRLARRSGKCRRGAGSGLLRPRRHRADHHRRQSRARAARRRPLPRRRDEARPGRGNEGADRQDRDAARPRSDRSRRRHPPHRHHQDGPCGALGDHRARPRRRRFRAGGLWRRGAPARLRRGARARDRQRDHSARAGAFLGVRHAGGGPAPRLRQHLVHAARRRVVFGNGENLQGDGAAGPRHGGPRPDVVGRHRRALRRHALCRPGARRHRRAAGRAVHGAGPRRHQGAVRCRAPDPLRLLGRQRKGRDRQPPQRRDRRTEETGLRANREGRRGAGGGGVPRQAAGVLSPAPGSSRRRPTTGPR